MSLKNEITRTFAPFADPATEVQVVETSDSACTFQLVRRGDTLVGKARTSRRGIEVARDGMQWQSLQTFLASDAMAHLDELARVQTRVYRRARIAEDWVAGPATLDESASMPSTDAYERGTAPADGRTRILVLDGPAGMGKTTLCSRVASEQAAAWLDRRSSQLTLIISSKGRKLSRLNDAIAATLQDLRVPVFYPEIPVLVRHGLVTLVIDGFDELVDQDGYDDAWATLEELLNSVAGGGVLVLSSRDTFFSEQEFVRRAQRHDALLTGKLAFSFLRLLPWTRNEAGRLLELLGVEDARRTEVLKFYGDASRSPLLRPYFVAELAKVPPNGVFEVDPDRLVASVVSSFLRREAGLLFPGLDNGPDILRRFFWELTAEMRTQERDTLDLDVIQFYLDAVLEAERFPDEHRRKIVHRAGAVAFLDAAGERGRRSFPHEIIRDYFFAEALLKAILDGGSNLVRLLSLGAFGLDLAESVMEVVEGGAAGDLSRSHVQQLLDLAVTRPLGDPVALNAAALAFALLRAGGLPGDAQIRPFGLHLGTVSLAGVVAPPLQVRECNIGFLDASDARLTELETADTHVQRLRVSDGTRLGQGFNVVPTALERYTPRGMITVHDPSEIRAVLRRLGSGADAPAVPASPAEVLLEGLNRRWVRRFYMDTEDLADEPAFGHPLWPRLRAVLDRYGRLEVKLNKPVSGRPRNLLHLKDAKSLLERFHENPEQQREIDAIWAEVRAMT
jgi:hypothetical protein